ncbi:hypothetical protein [Streptomyces sp. NPDC096132]|uniref:hypothetical protein n=1 Tax=Streptomyces sp. NPDC096132 TaxID=3366075 RepID=UPI00382E36A5
MTPGSAQVWLGDLVRAMAASAADRAAARDIAELMGLLRVPTLGTEAIEYSPFPDDEDDHDGGPDTEFADWPTLPGADPAEEQEEVSEAFAAELPVLSPVGRTTVTEVDWEGVPSLAEATAGQAAPAPQAPPLLRPRSARAILNSALAVPDEQIGPVDIDTLVDAYAQHRVWTQLPRQPLPTLRFGVQVLVDLGDGMQLFARDQKQLLRQVQAMVGRERLDILYFSDSPLRGSGPGQRRSWGPYRPPAKGTRVLLLSDLGVGGEPLRPRRASTEVWLRLAQVVRRAGCGMVALVPYPKHRVPRVLSSRMPVITWSERTTVSTVNSALSAGRRS